MKNHRKDKVIASLPIIGIIVSLCMIITGVAGLLIEKNTYKADADAVEAFCDKLDAEIIQRDGYTLVSPADPDAGFIFYPGGMVADEAYIPLMAALAEEGIMSVLIEMPLNLAVLDINAADGIMEEFPSIGAWYIGGHSLGGAMAASYLEDNHSEFKGLVLLGAYSTADLSGTDLDVLSVYGANDGVMKREKYSECKINLPSDFTELVIEGGNHAYYGMYGEQKGDGKALITADEQIFITAAQISDFVFAHK